jgi:hypothetical protein
MDAVGFEAEKRIPVLDETLHAGSAGISKGIRWLGERLSGARKATS